MGYYLHAGYKYTRRFTILFEVLRKSVLPRTRVSHIVTAFSILVSVEPLCGPIYSYNVQVLQ